MKQYCRYCANACYGDVVWCHIKEHTMSDEQAKRINKCKDFEFNGLDCFDIEKKYKPREKSIPDTSQMKLGEM